MNDEVQFDEWQVPANEREQKTGFGAKLARVIMRFSGGRIQTESQAMTILFGIVVLIVVVSVIIYTRSNNTVDTPPVDMLFRTTPPSGLGDHVF